MRLHLAVPGRNFSLLNVGAWAQNIPVDTFDVPLFLFEQLNDPLSLCLRSLFDLVREAKLSSLEVEIALALGDLVNFGDLENLGLFGDRLLTHSKSSA